MAEHIPWTPEGAERLRATGEALTTALAEHAAAVSAADGRISDVFDANERLLPALLAYADAQFDLTGNPGWFGVLRQFSEDDEQTDVTPAPPPSSGISVLRRHDYAITDENAVLAAGRAAYLRLWPDDGEDDAATDVSHLGRALYQIAHADGWDALDDAPGLRPTGGVVVVVDQEEVLGPDPDDWPNDPFDVRGELRYREDDI